MVRLADQARRKYAKMVAAREKLEAKHARAELRRVQAAQKVCVCAWLETLLLYRGLTWRNRRPSVPTSRHNAN